MTSIMAPVITIWNAALCGVAVCRCCRINSIGFAVCYNDAPAVYSLQQADIKIDTPATVYQTSQPYPTKGQHTACK